MKLGLILRNLLGQQHNSGIINIINTITIDMYVSPAYFNNKDISNYNFALHLLALTMSLSLRKAGVKLSVCSFPLGNASSWTWYRQSVRHSVPVDGTQSSNSSCLFWKLGGGQRCHGVPRSVAALTICRMNKGGNTRTCELLLGNRQTDAHCTCEAD